MVSKKNCYAFFSLIFLIALVGKGWHWAKRGFFITRIHSHFIEEVGLKEEISSLKRAFEQPFFYLGRGRQSYAFVSEDGKYVIKLPRLDHFRLPLWMRSFSFFSKKKEAQFRDKRFRREFLFNSFQIASNELRQETALLFSHLGKTDHLKQKLNIIDPLGRSYFLDLDQTIFVLQRKEPLLFSYRSLEELQERLSLLLNWIEGRAKKGICNKDPTFLKNFGFDGKQIFQIDIGSFYYPKESMSWQSSFQQTAGQLKNWLKDEAPDLIPWFDERVSL